MSELQLALDPSYDPVRPPADGRRAVSLPQAAFFASVAVHVVAGYALSLQKWAGPAPPSPTSDFFLFEMPPPRQADPAPGPAVEPAPDEVPPPEVEEPTPVPPRAAEVVPEPTVVVEPAAEPVVVREAAPAEQAAPAEPEPVVDFDEERRRAANEVVSERSTRQYMTFSLDDVVPPRPAAEPPPPPSIFDGGGGGGRSVGTVGQQRTKLGRKLAEFCNALTGGFGVGLQGFGLFSACASPESGLSGMLPEVRPEYLDLMPECVDTRDTAPALALEAPFPTIKCRLVKQEDPEEQP